jgi:hypothetical protein
MGSRSRWLLVVSGEWKRRPPASQRPATEEPPATDVTGSRCHHDECWRGGTASLVHRPSKTYAGSLRKHASVAQLDRALVFGTKGWGFKSLRAYWINENSRQLGHRIPAPVENSKERRRVTAYRSSVATPIGLPVYFFLTAIIDSWPNSFRRKLLELILSRLLGRLGRSRIQMARETERNSWGN